MQRTRKATLLLLFCVVSSALSAIDLSKINLNYQYDPDADIRIDHRVVESGDQLEVYYEVATELTGEWDQFFLLQDKYNSVQHDTLRVFQLDTLAKSRGSVYYKLSFAKPKRALLLIAWVNLTRGTYRLEDVRVKTPVGFPTFLPKDANGLPILKNYVLADNVRLDGKSEQYHVFRYIDDFGPADPAMGMMKAIAPNIAIDSSFYSQAELEVLDPYRFYLIQTDSLSQKAITLLKCPNYYPELKRLEELTPPLTYITTASEIKTIRDSNSKKAFEDFWVNTYGSRFRAKAAIKHFYNQIEVVNELFTDYKQGWKTDRGMVYLIFGYPYRVFRSERTEVWQYIDGTEFEFIRISTLFTPSMYSLKRSRDYEELWYDRVGEIRKGI